jgi:hypothetical protein
MMSSAHNALVSSNVNIPISTRVVAESQTSWTTAQRFDGARPDRRRRVPMTLTPTSIATGTAPHQREYGMSWPGGGE